MHILDLPDTREELARWLELRIVRGELGEFVAESAAVGPLNQTVTLSILDPAELSNVVEHGLSALSEDHLRCLAGEPGLLFLMQDRILESGGSYWTNLANEETSTDERHETLGFLLRSLPAPIEIGIPTPAPVSQQRISRRLLFSLVAAASLVLVVGTAVLFSDGNSGGWGWQEASALTAEIPADAYLNQLADAASEWFKSRAASKEELATRLTEFRAGCDVLLSAEHRQLSAEDRTWLLDRCRVWRSEIDQRLADLETTATLEEVRELSDGMVRGLMDELKQRAASV
jgi:hypothetical protein